MPKPPEPVAPTAEQEARIAQAIVQKATRILALPTAPFGAWGDPSEFGTAMVRPDYAIKELLFGLQGVLEEIDLTDLVTTDDVIRAGLQLDPETFPPARLPDVERAISAAESWVSTALYQSFGVA